MSDFKPFDDRLNGLIAALSPAARRKLAGEIAKELRKSQQQRIKQQKAPDGSPYQARKRQPLRAKSGRIKRAMFQKLRTSRYMKATGLGFHLPLEQLSIRPGPPPCYSATACPYQERPPFAFFRIPTIDSPSPRLSNDPGKNS